MSEKLKAQVRRGKHIPQEHRNPKVDWNAEAETKIYTDESGKPLNREDLQNYDLENLTLFDPSNVANQERNTEKEETPNKRFHKLLDKSLQDPANPYDATKAIAGYTFGVPLTAIGLTTAPAATVLGTALGTVGDLAGNYLVGKYVQDPDKPLNIGTVDSPTPRQIGSFAGGLIGGTIGAYKGLNQFNKRIPSKNTTTQTTLKPISHEERMGIPKHERKTKSPYQQIGTATEPTSRNETLQVTGSRFGKEIGHGSQQTVFEDLSNPNQVLKVFDDRLFRNIEDIKAWHPKWFKRNQLPIQLPMRFQGYVKGAKRIYPVYSQQKVIPIGDILPYEWTQKYLPIIDNKMQQLGYNGHGTYYGKFTVGDISPFNIGLDNSGNLKFFDVDVYQKGGKLRFW